MATIRAFFFQNQGTLFRFPRKGRGNLPLPPLVTRLLQYLKDEFRKRFRKLKFFNMSKNLCQNLCKISATFTRKNDSIKVETVLKTFAT